MTDRELLELAAKAAGWSFWQSKHGYLNVIDPSGESHVCCQGWAQFDSISGEKLPALTLADGLAECNWNPLTDDGDALRLEVKLRLYVEIDKGHTMIGNVAWHEDSIASGYQHKGDPYAATRRAIVRAAAEIGRNMK